MGSPPPGMGSTECSSTDKPSASGMVELGMGPAGGRDAAWVSSAGSMASAALVIGYPPERTERVGILSVQPLARGDSYILDRPEGRTAQEGSLPLPNRLPGLYSIALQEGDRV